MDNKQDFEWTDALKIECLDYLMQQFISKEWAGFSSEVEEFKKSKEHKVEEKRIEILDFRKMPDNKVEGHSMYCFALRGFIPHEKYEAVRVAIERELNNEPLSDIEVELFKLKRDYKALLSINEQFVEHIECLNKEKESSDSIPTLERQENKYASTVGMPVHKTKLGNDIILEIPLPENKPQESKQDSKGWEIQCIVLDSKNYWIQKDGLYKSDLFGSHLHSSWLLSNGGIIHSVKRLSDGEVFSVGLNNNGKIIEKFFEGWNGMEIHYTDGSASLLLEETKLPLTEQPKPRQMWNKHTGIHDESVLCTGMKCQEYNPLNKEHHP